VLSEGTDLLELLLEVGNFYPIFIRKLVQAGSNNPDRVTPLHTAVRIDDQGAISLLLSIKDRDTLFILCQQDIDGQTPLYYASMLEKHRM